MANTKKPIITIVTVCYNPGSEIKKTVDSILAQDYFDYEYLVQDGGSTDGTLEFLNKQKVRFEEKKVRFKIFSDKDKGIYDAMNKAVNNAEGEWINFMNAGDSFYSATVLGEIFNGHDYADEAILYGDCVEQEYKHYYMFRKAFDKIESRMPFSHQSAFARRDCLLKYPFNTEYRIGSDYDFLLSMFKKGYNFKDTGVIVCIISKDGVSSLRLYDTYMETLEIRKSHGIEAPTEEELNKKIKEMKVKQFVMDYFPDFIKKLIRRFQLVVRKQNAELTLPPWEIK